MRLSSLLCFSPCLFVMLCWSAHAADFGQVMQMAGELAGRPYKPSAVVAPEELRRLVDKHQSGQSDFSAPLWTLMMFEAFLRQVVDASDSIGLPVPAEALA